MAVTEQEATGTGIGAPAPRKEDARLLTGQARYVDDLSVPGMVWMAVVRSPHAHARIAGVDLSKARAAEGVVAAFAGADLEGDWKAPLPMAWPVTEDIKNPDHFPLATSEARYVGDGVAVVLARSRALAKDIAELVEVDYEPLTAVVDVEAGLADGAPLVHEELGTNHCYTWAIGGGEEVEKLFEDADVVVEERYRQQRLIPNPMEPRGVLAQPTSATGEVTLFSSTQIPHITRVTLALATGVPESKLRVVAPDVGGGFGSKLQVYPEEALAVALAVRLGLPVKWIEERSENALATHHGRDMIQEISLAATSEGTLTAVRVRLTVSMGAYLMIITPGTPLLGAWVYGGAYDIKGYAFECRGVFTNQTPTDAYRGAGRPEATYAIERAMDALARRLDMDPVELRRRNFITEFPATIASGLTIDSGDYHAALDRALEILDYDDVRREQADRRTRGDTKQLGVGFSTYIEMCGLAPSRILGALRYAAGGWEAATIRCLPTGTVQVLTGTTPHGQSHDTTFAQVVADRLGVGYDEIEVLHGDTSLVPLGMDTYGSRSLAIGMAALCNAADKVVAKSQKIVAHALEVAEEDLEYDRGTFRVAGTARTMTVKEAAFAAWHAHDLPDGLEPTLEETAVYDPSNFSWPAGTHIAVVEVDTETGAVELIRYIAVDDVGTVVNPQVVEGQVQGGIAQGVAQALWEEAQYDESGTLLNGSLVDYLVPSAADLPHIEVDRTVTESPNHPLGAKGVGETGTIASTPAVINAVLDALAPFGVTDIDMPATPERVWRAIEEARS
jgi:aerobic carbon-monoxide dehydrogenase large subunit